MTQKILKGSLEERTKNYQHLFTLCILYPNNNFFYTDRLDQQVYPNKKKYFLCTYQNPLYPSIQQSISLYELFDYTFLVFKQEPFLVYPSTLVIWIGVDRVFN
ncbi:hypothetical protein BpHYR1_000928 [Brachionus plicatilis]|uniref:Uncharacterized protein n=1 Tax=Brachionus plicatilis TaxID=10195 RepID=A0A3M7P1X8_BRAPC|nr:hypothetical protein BpHYR1_000928 [Brachionus plicatilis]